jgi:hypothetical protein
MREKSFYSKALATFREKRKRSAAHSFLLRIYSRGVVGVLKWFEPYEILPGFLNFLETKSGFCIGRTYFSTNNAGLLSCASTVLSDLIEARFPIARINSRLGLALYKRRATQDNWADFFEQPHNANIDWTPSKTLLEHQPPVSEWWSMRYESLPISEIQELVINFFTPSQQVREKIKTLIDEYGITPENLIGVHYRGTDKEYEIPTPSVDSFIEATREITYNQNSKKILVLTDEPDALSMFLEAFPGRVVYAPNLIMGSGDVGAHSIDSKDKSFQGQLFLANLLLVSRCSQIVTHTGNGALWEVLFRGSSQGVVQVEFEKSD